MELTLKDLAERLAGEVCGDGAICIRGLAGIKEAQAGELTFLDNRKLAGWLTRTQATAVILPVDHPETTLASIRVADPRATFRRAMELFADGESRVPAGVHPTAVIGVGTELGAEVAIGAYVTIGEHCRIGERVTILPGVTVGNQVEIGRDSLIYPRAVIWKDTRIGERVIVHSGAVIGDDGFGFLTRAGRHSKVPQLGRVVIEEDVEIGANTCIDRATTGITRIRRGTRIDNLVQVAHNVTVGEDGILCAQVGIAGSASLGARVTMGGQSGVIGHVEIGDDVMIGGQGGVTKSVPARTQVSGYPATPHGLARRMYAALRKLPDLVREVREMRGRVAELEEERKRDQVVELEEERKRNQ